MRIAVTGASGYIGRNVAQFLAQMGHDVLAVSRQASAELAALGPHIVCKTIRSGVPTPDWLAGCDAVIHLAGRAHTTVDKYKGRDLFDEANYQLTLSIAEAADAAQVRRFIFVSSLGVHGNWSPRPVAEDSPPVIDTPYAHSKYKAERLLTERYRNRLEALVIVRPPMVYGLDCPGNFPRLVRLVQSGLPLPFGSVTGARSFIHVQNLASFLSHCALSKTFSGTFVIGDGSDFVLPELIAEIASVLGKTSSLYRFPPRVLRMVARLVGRERELNSLTRPMLVDWSRARTVAKWSPSIDRNSALINTLAPYATRS